MNKKVYLITLAVFCVCAAIFAPRLYISTLPSVNTVKIKQIEYAEYVNAIGEIVSADSVEVTTQVPIVVKNICKQLGDSVESGEMLVEIDREKSAKSIIELGEYASIANASSAYISPDYVNIIEMIPQAIYSECAGVVSSLSAKNGGYIAAGGTVMTISGSEPLSVNVGISENKISKVSLGQKVTVSAGAFGDKTYQGYVASIADSATKEYSAALSQTVVQANIAIENADEYVKSGYTAEVKILVSDKRQINVLPYEALISEGKNSYVYVFENGTAKRRQITVGAETTEGIEICSGIADDDVIIYSDDELINGGYVAIKTVN